MIRHAFLHADLALAACLSGLLGACGGSSTQAKEPEADQKMAREDVQKQFLREADPIQKHPVANGATWRAYLEAQEPPVVEAQKGYMSVTADLGWESELYCFVYQDMIDAGSSSKTLIAEATKAVDFQQLAPYRLDHVGLEPVLSIRGLYHVDQNGVVAAGDYKLTVVPRAEHPIICVHDAPGYAESFARVTKEFAKSFEFERNSPEPIRGELWAMQLEDVPIGFTKRSTYELKDGNFRTISISARFLPTSPGELSFEDQVSVVTSNATGTVLSAKYVSLENGESDLEMDLEKTKQGYDYAGTIQGKEVKGSFRARALVDRYGLERRLKKLAGSGKKSRFELLEYVPSIDPTQPSTVDYELTPEDDEIHVKTSLGKRSMLMVANKRGVIKRVLMQVGSRTIQIGLLEEIGEI